MTVASRQDTEAENNVIVFKETKIKNIKITDAKPSANELARFAEVRRKSTISQVTEPLKEEIINGFVHTIDEMKAWLQPLGYSDAIGNIRYYERS